MKRFGKKPPNKSGDPPVMAQNKRFIKTMHPLFLPAALLILAHLAETMDARYFGYAFTGAYAAVFIFLAP